MLKNFKWFRRLKGGYWVKTKYRGWITQQTHQMYLKYGWDPLITEEEYYKSSIDIKESKDKDNEIKFIDIGVNLIKHMKK